MFTSSGQNLWPRGIPRRVTSGAMLEHQEVKRSPSFCSEQRSGLPVQSQDSSSGIIAKTGQGGQTPDTAYCTLPLGGYLPHDWGCSKFMVQASLKILPLQFELGVEPIFFSQDNSSYLSKATAAAVHMCYPGKGSLNYKASHARVGGRCSKQVSVWTEASHSLLRARKMLFPFPSSSQHVMFKRD